MKLHKKLEVSGSELPLNTDDVRLDLFKPGRAVFDVVADEPLTGSVRFIAGYDPQTLQQVFTGYIENSFAIDKKQQRIFCREFSAALSSLLPLSLRNVTLNQVLTAISSITGLEFVTPEQEYTTKAVSAFYSLGSGYHCLDSLARVFEIPKFIWQQQGDGKIFVGSWEHSFWQSRPVELPLSFQSNSGVANKSHIPVMPKLRPGVFLNSDSFITNVQWSGAHQHIAWSKNPWGTRWTNRSSV